MFRTPATGGTSEVPPSRFKNTTTVDKLIEACKKQLGASVDEQNAVRTLKYNWVDTMADVRLLHKEGELMQLRTIGSAVLKWLSDECGKTFDDDSLIGSDARVYEYAFDMDTHGIVYNLATDHGSKTWENPGDAQLIRVQASSTMHDSAPPTAILGRKVVRCVTKPEKGSWFLIDFSPRRIKPSHYSLRHYSTWDTEALRFWDFEGSVDGQPFELIKRHRKDTSLSQKGQWFTWKVNSEKFYSTFRIRQTDFNSNRHYYLACSGFEIYGQMEDGTGAARGDDAGTLTFIHSYDFDTNGICYWLGTNRGAQRWHNPALRGMIGVIYSSLAPDSKPSYYMVGRETVRCVTEPKKMSWVVFDFKNVKIVPSHYSLRHYVTFDTECLRNWKFEASNDTTNGVDGQWDTLAVHRNDTGLNHKGGTHTWALSEHSVRGKSYSKFRIFQYDVNSNQHHYLACSGFEIYGTVVAGMEASPLSQQPTEKTRTFKHGSDFDGGGLFYFLGTKGGTQPWANPVDIRLVEVKASSLMSDSAPLSSLCGRRSVRCVTKPQQKSWMSVNLKNIKVKLTHYTLRHYNSWDTEALRYWNLEASNDGISWIPIRQHHDDRALRKAGQSHTWAVDTPQYFSQFRVYMTGRNSNNHWYLATSGMELYGVAYGGVVSQRADANLQVAGRGGMGAGGAGGPMRDMGRGGGPQGRPGIDWIYEADLDKKGICYWLATNCGTQPWKNPVQRGFIQASSSGLMNDSTPLETVLGLQVVRCVTKPIKNAWIALDFLQYAIKPTHYTLRHYSSWDTEALRNWRFEGSMDGQKWVTIREHVNDTALKMKGQTHTWPIQCNAYFQRFRIFQFDKNSNNHYYLSLSGFEIYGSVVRQHRQLTWDAWPRNKSKKLHINGPVNTVVNTGSEDTWQTVKSREPIVFQQGRAEFSVIVQKTANTSNSWRFMLGIAPEEFTCTGSKQWLGSQQSWGYIAGTGGKCYDVGKSIAYGQKWGKEGDVCTCIIDRSKRSIEYVLNGVSQGAAFDNFPPSGKFFAACSLTATNSALRLMSRVTPRSGPATAVVKMGGGIAPSGAGVPRVPQAGIPNFGWDLNLKSPHLAIFPDGVSVTNRGSNDTWQGIVSKAVFTSGRHSFDIQIVNDLRSTNTWKFIVGVVPMKFDPRRQAWLGSQGSWGYIGGNGGKCHQVGKPVSYGKTFGGTDTVRTMVDLDRKTIEFFVNGASQGVAYSNVVGPVRPAVSLTAKGACLRILNVR